MNHAPTCPAIEGESCACAWSAPITSGAELRAVVEEALTLADRLASPALSLPLNTAAGGRC